MGTAVAEEEEGGREEGQVLGVHHGEESGAPAEDFPSPPVADLSQPSEHLGGSPAHGHPRAHA